MIISFLVINTLFFFNNLLYSNDINKKIISTIKNIKTTDLIKDEDKMECYLKIENSIKDIYEFYKIKNNGTFLNNHGTFHYDYYGNLIGFYDKNVCISNVTKEIINSNNYKEPINDLDKVIKKSRTFNFTSNDNYYNKVYPLINNRLNYLISDLIMFNKYFNLTSTKQISLFLSMCKYSHNRDKYFVDGWEIDLKTNKYFTKLEKDICFNKKNIDTIKYVKHHYDKSCIAKILLDIMDQAPKDFINVNNYLLLELYLDKYNTFNKENEKIYYLVNNKNYLTKKNGLIIKINNLVDREEIVNEIFINVIRYPRKKNIYKFKNKFRSIINQCFSNDDKYLDLTKLLEEYYYVDIENVIKSIKNILRKKIYYSIFHRNYIAIEFNKSVKFIRNIIFNNTFLNSSINNSTKTLKNMKKRDHNEFFITGSEGFPHKVVYPFNNTKKNNLLNNYKNISMVNIFFKSIFKVKSMLSFILSGLYNIFLQNNNI